MSDQLPQLPILILEMAAGCGPPTSGPGTRLTAPRCYPSCQTQRQVEDETVGPKVIHLIRRGGAAQPAQAALCQAASTVALSAEYRRSSMYNILTIIGVIVVVLAVLAFFGLR